MVGAAFFERLLRTQSTAKENLGPGCKPTS